MIPGDMAGNAVGWPQFDGGRKRAFLAWCGKKVLDWRSDAANYGYMVEELLTTERSALARLKATKTLGEASDDFERYYERAGVSALASRRRYAQRAMSAYTIAPKPIEPIVPGVASVPAPVKPKVPIAGTVAVGTAAAAIVAGTATHHAYPAIYLVGVAIVAVVSVTMWLYLKKKTA